MPASNTVYSVRLDTRRLIRLLSAIAVFLLLVHSVLTVIHYTQAELPWLLRQLFDVDEENNIPTWFSSIILLLASATLAILGHEKQVEQDRWASYWLALAAGFLLLSLDEMAGLHETLNSIIESSWAIYGLAVAAVCAALLLHFLFHLPTPTAVLFLLSGGLYLGGAIGVELYTEPYLENDALDTLAYNLWTVVEEGMEMFGVILFLNTLLQYIGDGSVEVRADVRNGIRAESQ